MLNIRPVSDIRNKFNEIEIALDEADFEATNNIKRLTRKDVFTRIRSKIGEKRNRIK